MHKLVNLIFILRSAASFYEEGEYRKSFVRKICESFGIIRYLELNFESEYYNASTAIVNFISGQITSGQFAEMAFKKISSPDYSTTDDDEEDDQNRPYKKWSAIVYAIVGKDRRDSRISIEFIRVYSDIEISSAFNSQSRFLTKLSPMLYALKSYSFMNFNGTKNSNNICVYGLNLIYFNYDSKSEIIRRVNIDSNFTTDFSSLLLEAISTKSFAKIEVLSIINRSDHLKIIVRFGKYHLSCCYFLGRADYFFGNILVYKPEVLNSMCNCNLKSNQWRLCVAVTNIKENVNVTDKLSRTLRNFIVMSSSVYETVMRNNDNDIRPVSLFTAVPYLRLEELNENRMCGFHNWLKRHSGSWTSNYLPVRNFLRHWILDSNAGNKSTIIYRPYIMSLLELKNVDLESDVSAFTRYMCTSDVYKTYIRVTDEDIITANRNSGSLAVPDSRLAFQCGNGFYVYTGPDIYFPFPCPSAVFMDVTILQRLGLNPITSPPHEFYFGRTFTHATSYMGRLNECTVFCSSLLRFTTDDNLPIQSDIQPVKVLTGISDSPLVNNVSDPVHRYYDEVYRDLSPIWPNVRVTNLIFKPPFEGVVLTLFSTSEPQLNRPLDVDIAYTLTKLVIENSGDTIIPAPVLFTIQSITAISYK